MLRRHTATLLLAMVITAIGMALSLCSSPIIVDAELGARDFLTRHGRRTEANPKLVFLAIDNASISIDAQSDLKELFGVEDESSPEGRALKMMSRPWPWPRSIYGLILDRLVGAGAKVVAFDLTFPKPSEQDEDFRTALDRHAGHVVVGSNFINSAYREKDAYDVSLTQPTPSLIPRTGTPDPRIGFVNFWPDHDLIVRSAQFRTNLTEVLGGISPPGEADFLSLAARSVANSGRPEVIPQDRDSHTFRYTAPPQEGFPQRSLFEIFVPDYWARNYKSGEVFRDAIVVVGAAGNWQHDEHQTPFGLMSGPELQLNVFNALLHREFIHPAPWPLWWLAWIGAGAVAFACCTLGKSPIFRLTLLVIALLAWLGLQFLCFNRFALYLPFIGPASVLVLTGLTTIVFDLIRAGAEQIRLHRNIAERKRIQETLEAAKDELERRVQERTVELTQTNAKLAGLLNEKELLLKEVHHRVKNNLQVISSLLNLQSEYIKDPESLQIFAESRNRVRSMALIHEKLYQSHDLARIDFADYLRSLTRNLQSSFSKKSAAVHIGVEVDDLMLGVDSAVPCGLIVNELVTNCFKYAFPAERAGEIQISMTRSATEGLKLSVTDNGVGFPKNVDFKNTDSLGMQIINTLAEQLDGTIHMTNGTGTKFEICFPEKA